MVIAHQHYQSTQESRTLDVLRPYPSVSIPVYIHLHTTPYTGTLRIVGCTLRTACQTRPSKITTRTAQIPGNTAIPRLPPRRHARLAPVLGRVIPARAPPMERVRPESLPARSIPLLSIRGKRVDAALFITPKRPGWLFLESFEKHLLRRRTLFPPMPLAVDGCYLA